MPVPCISQPRVTVRPLALTSVPAPYDYFVQLADLLITVLLELQMYGNGYAYS